MSTRSFIAFLSEDLKLRYYQELIIDSAISDELWEDMISYLGDTCKKGMGAEEINNQSLDVEEIIKVERNTVEQVVSGFDENQMIKLTYVMSPVVEAFFQKLFPEIDFDAGRTRIGAIQIDEIRELHNKIIESVNLRMNG